MFKNIKKLFFGNKGCSKKNMKLLVVPFLLFSLISCSPKVEEIILCKYLIDRSYHENNDSTIRILITINTYEDFFGGRESIFSFKREFYQVDYPKLINPIEVNLLKSLGIHDIKNVFLKFPYKKVK